MEDAIVLFREKKEKTHFKRDSDGGRKDSNAYFKITEYAALLDQCFGLTGYQIHYPNFQFQELPNGQVLSCTRCVIEILDEDRNVCYTMEGWGTSEITYSKSNERYIGLENVGSVTCSQGQKAGCQVSGAFGSRTEMEGKTNARPASAEKNGGIQDAPTGAIVKEFFIQKPIDSFWKDRNGMPAYRIECQEIVENAKLISKCCEILLYPNQYKNCAKKVNEMVAWSQSDKVAKGTRMKIKVLEAAEDKKNRAYENSYIFKSFA